MRLRIISVDYEEPIVLHDRRRDAAGDYHARPATGFPQRVTRGVEYLPVKRSPECETRSVAPGEQRVPPGVDRDDGVLAPEAGLPRR